jgi:hypothetical protein
MKIVFDTGVEIGSMQKDKSSDKRSFFWEIPDLTRDFQALLWQVIFPCCVDVTQSASKIVTVTRIETFWLEG